MTTVLPNCEGVWSYGSASLRGKDETTQSLLTCTLIQILERGAEAAFKSRVLKMCPGSQHSDCETALGTNSPTHISANAN